MIKRVFMTCGDADAVSVLKNCAAHMQSRGKVLVVETVMPPVGEPGPATTFDILMLLANEGHIRPESELREIILGSRLSIRPCDPDTVSECAS